MNPIIYIAKRYAISKSKTKAINIITAIASLGVIVGAMALFVVLSVFAGLEDYTKSFASALDPDYTITPKEGKTFELNKEEITALSKFEGVKKILPVVEDRVIFTYNEKQLAANIKGVPSDYFTFLPVLKNAENKTTIADNTYQVIVGKTLVYDLGISTYSENHFLEGMAMIPGEGFFQSPEEAYVRLPLYPINYYSFNNVDIDRKYIFSTLKTAQELLSLGENQYSKLEIIANESFDSNGFLKLMNKNSPNAFIIKNRAEMNESLYRMLKTESLAVYLVFTLIIIITLFCLCGAIIMIILEKRDNIKTLTHVGFSMRQVQKIFFYQGIIVTIAGTIIGLLAGVFLVWLQQQFALIRINEDFAYPVKWQWQNFVIVIVTLLVLGSIACVIAASRVRNILH